MTIEAPDGENTAAGLSSWFAEVLSAFARSGEAEGGAGEGAGRTAAISVNEGRLRRFHRLEHARDAVFDVLASGETDVLLSTSGAAEGERDTRFVTVEVGREKKYGEFFSLDATLGVADSFLVDKSYCSALRNIPVAVCEHARAVFGSIGDRNLLGMTSLDFALRRSRRASLSEARRYLRGYSWLTICPRELAQKFDDVALLIESGAFRGVQQNADGSLLLCATSSIGEYDENAMERVFTALSPIIAPGSPHFDPAYPDLKVVYRDAHR
ncbi:hypothetical protein [Actinomadura rubteroloni]|uniref:hypothetical protein n=1 Tax=Actinomadura rubteroloni TaxID=1926885 RepID=UPI0011AFF845|nr:hypothetical protein [Actinomadura rubteroloni]